MKILVTGGAGFIGSNFIRYLLDEYSEIQVYNIDALTYAGKYENMESFFYDSRHKFIEGSITDVEILRNVMDEGLEYVINFAAESHVDNSIVSAKQFIDTNINGVYHLLNIAKKYNIKKILQVSTDEVYGSANGTREFYESDILAPQNPYAATKASADLICLSFYKTFNVPIIISRCCNNYGTHQDYEKFIPKMINLAYNNKDLQVYGNGQNIREWLHVYDHCTALLKLLLHGKKGEIYNVGSGIEKNNNDIANYIIQNTNTDTNIIYVPDRKGHDYRYRVNSNKIRDELNWKPIKQFKCSLLETIEWYISKEDIMYT